MDRDLTIGQMQGESICFRVQNIHREKKNPAVVTSLAEETPGAVSQGPLLLIITNTHTHTHAHTLCSLRVKYWTRATFFS